MGRWPGRRFFKPFPQKQLELPLARKPEPDRNHKFGGRSFYFFDFDDNVAFLTTPTFLFHRETKAPLQISSREFAQQSLYIGESGPYVDYYVDNDSKTGSFRNFRDKDISWLQRLVGSRQMFVDDLALALTLPEMTWKGPSWDCFFHAVFNARPLALITARGHSPKTIRAGIDLWVREGHLPHAPNYLAIYPVSYPDTKAELSLPSSHAVPLLKQRALRASVLKAFKKYGHNPHHRFGMSDDDPRNIEWITDEMRRLKRDFPQNSFFIIQTHGDQSIKHEIFTDHTEDRLITSEIQMKLFEE